MKGRAGNSSGASGLGCGVGDGGGTTGSIDLHEIIKFSICSSVVFLSERCNPTDHEVADGR